VVVVDREGMIQFVNPAAEVLFARRAADLVGQPFGFPVVAGETTELDIVRQADSPIVAEMRVVETEWEGGQASLASLRDISERKRTEEMLRQQAEQLRQAQKMEAVGQLAGGIAHEFNNLLAAILGFSTLLQRRLDPHDVRSSYATQISDVSRRAASLIQQLLVFTRQQVLKPQLLDCNRVVRETEEMLRPILGRNIDLTHHLDPDLGLVEADPVQLQQLLVNLLVNARDAMPEGGVIRLETANVKLQAAQEARHLNAPPGAYVRLTVSDTGIGMESEVRSRLFEPFFTTKEIGKGTGLGLAVVYGIVQQNRGDIEVQSAPAAGTTFTIYLPRVARMQAPVLMPETVEVSPSGSETVLLVEDEQSVRASLRSALEHKGYRVLEAANAEEAIRLCEQYAEPIHLLLTDIVMPGMNGHVLSQHLTSLYPAMRILLISGGDADRGAHSAVINTPVAFLPKPFTIDELATRTRAVLDLPQADFDMQNVE
jgi:signal transduction histidine kinase/ActR/RegA family two-component response regulator